MANVEVPAVITPPTRNGDTAPTAPVDNAAVIAPPEADQSSAVGNDDRWTDLEQQLTDVFVNRAAQSQGPPDGAGAADDSTGGEAGAVISPADQGQPPVEVPIESAAPGTAPTPTPAVPAAAPTPVAGESGLAQPEPGATTAYDPFAVTPIVPLEQQVPPIQQPVQPVQQIQQPGYVDILGEQVPIAQVQTMRDTYNWATSLRPEESHAINQFIQQRRLAEANGQQPPAAIQPVQPAFNPAVLPNQQTASQQPQSPGFVVPPPPTIDPASVDDPALAQFLQQQQQWFAAQAQQQQQVIQQQQQALAQVQQQTESVVLRDVEQQQRVNFQRAEQAGWDFAVKYNLQPAELDVVVARLAQSNIIQPLIERRAGDVYTGMLDGLETTYWTDPAMRQRAIQQEVAPAVTDARETQQRAAKLGALGGSGGAVPQTTPPATQQQRHAAMVAEIAAAQNQQPS